MQKSSALFKLVAASSLALAQASWAQTSPNIGSPTGCSGLSGSLLSDCQRNSTLGSSSSSPSLSTPSTQPLGTPSLGNLIFSGLQTRNFTYVGDTITGLLLAGAELTGFDVINVGTDAHHTIRDLNEVIFAHLDWRPEEIDYQLDKPVGVLSRAASIEKSQKLLGWAPSDRLEHGVTRTVDWYASTVSPERLGRLNDLLMTR